MIKGRITINDIEYVYALEEDVIEAYKAKNDLAKMQLVYELLQEDLDIQKGIVRDMSDALYAIGKEVQSVGVDLGSEPDEPDEDNDVIYVHPGENIQEAINRADDGDTIVLRSGVEHHGTMDLSGRIIKIEGEGEEPVVVNNMVKLENLERVTAPEEVGVIHYKYALPVALWHWVGNHPGDAFNNRLMFPLLLTLGDDPLIYNPDGFHALGEGDFYHDGGDNLYVRKPADKEDYDLYVCPYPRIVWGDENSSCVLRNIKFIGCSNTGKTGAISLPGRDWSTSNDVTMDLANTIGIECGQGGDRSSMRGILRDSALINVVATRSGQMGWWGAPQNCVFESCGHSGSNWRGFDHWWEASHKFENMHGCVFNDWTADDCNGPGFWGDGVTTDDGIDPEDKGGNTENILNRPVVRNCARAGIELELGTSGNQINDVYISNIIVNSS